MCVKENTSMERLAAIQRSELFWLLPQLIANSFRQQRFQLVERSGPAERHAGACRDEGC